MTNSVQFDVTGRRSDWDSVFFTFTRWCRPPSTTIRFGETNICSAVRRDGGRLPARETNAISAGVGDWPGWKLSSAAGSGGFGGGNGGCDRREKGHGGCCYGAAAISENSL